MSAPDLGRVAAVFEAARTAPPEERERRLREACADDPALEAEVRSLLAHDAEGTDFLSTPALLLGELGPGGEPEGGLESELVLRRLGRYRILGRLGAGGMGVVYLAEQDNPRRRVALKVLRAGSVGTVQRFTREAELLGRLQHPGIAQIHEAFAGDARTGLPPYFALEFVEGRSLCEHARAERLGLTARLALLTAVCEAVQHAHQRGIVHRDLKPANILVDATGQPKVLDFGVARAVGAELGAAARTRTGEIVGTLAYMSPEQAGGDPEQLDTRADVYALGVLAYELLSERLPFELSGLPLTEALRRIRELEPPRLGSLRRELAGDLETIVAKALEKDPERRYDSASELARDIRRHLADEPIAARPPSTLYQLKKFARRNSSLVGGAAAFVLLLVLGVVVVGRLALRLAEQRDAARAAELRADEHRRTAEREATEAGAMTSFLEDVLSAAEPYVAGKEATIADAVRWAEERADERFAEHPALLASLRQRLASIHFARGELEQALAESQAALAQHETSAAEDPLALAFSLTTSGTLRQTKGELEQAEAELRRAVELFEQHAEADDPAHLTALTTLSAVLFERQAYAEAEPMMRAVLAARTRVLGPEHPYTLTARNNLANLLMKTGRAAEAEPMLLAILETSRRTLPTGHANTIQATYNYADALRERGDFEVAEPLFREAIELGRTHLPAGHWITGLHRARLGELLVQVERLEEAELELRAGLATLATALGEDHARTQRAARALAALRTRLAAPE